MVLIESAIAYGLAGLTGVAMPLACQAINRWRKWCLGRVGFDRAREDARRTYEEVIAGAGRNAQRVMAQLDVWDESGITDVVADLPPGINLPLHAAYRYSRIVRSRMVYPSRTKANILVAADHLKSVMEEHNVRKTLVPVLMPLALELVFVRDKNELQAESLMNMLKGTWRQARDLAV
nr:hypothetical protein 1 [Ginkgo biloba tombusvirus]